MTNYGELADQLNIRRSLARQTQEPAAERGADSAQVYERVKVLVSHEIDKANVELQRRRLALIERLFLPSYQGRLCLSFGSELLCIADLQEMKGQITAVLQGPPNHQEISRKVFALNEFRPEQIAVEIVSGLLRGEFS
jgi:hypothetical protein